MGSQAVCFVWGKGETKNPIHNGHRVLIPTVAEICRLAVEQNFKQKGSQTRAVKNKGISMGLEPLDQTELGSREKSINSSLYCHASRPKENRENRERLLKVSAALERKGARKELRARGFPTNVEETGGKH